MAIKERRRYPRIPVSLEVEIRRTRWERHVTADVSRRGLFVLTAGPLPIGQLMQIHVMLPRGTAPLEMMAKVARRVPPMAALAEGRLPGTGLEFFCLSTQVLNQWEELLREAGRWLDLRPEANSYTLYQLLQQPPSSELESGRAGSGGAGARVDRSGGLPFVDEAVGAFSGPPAVVEDRANLIFRPQNLERLALFIDEELKRGRFDLKIPYRMEERAAVNLRIIHPRTQEEFLLPGSIQAAQERDGYAVRFEAYGAETTRLFRQFMTSGEAPAEIGGMYAPR